LSGSLLVLLLVLALVFYLAYRWVAEKSPPR
jgi:hypothetical protein